MVAMIWLVPKSASEEITRHVESNAYSAVELLRETYAGGIILMILRTVRAKAVELDSTMVKLVAAVKVEFVFWMVKAGLEMPTCS